MLLNIADLSLLVIKSCLLLLNCLFRLLGNRSFQFEFLLYLLVFSLLFLNDPISFDDLLLTFFQLFFHFLYLALVHIIGVCKLCALILERCYKALSFLNELFLVFELTL